MVEEGLGAAGDLVECGLGGGDIGGGEGDPLAGGSAVKASVGGEFAFGLPVPLLGVVEVVTPVMACSTASSGSNRAARRGARHR